MKVDQTDSLVLDFDVENMDMVFDKLIYIDDGFMTIKSVCNATQPWN